ncbi:MAG: hypothetical protein HQK51_10065 [Oligoflexia bacterium]|nr:hypothetical protein [Oligoflexia bacterium]
MFNKTFSWFNRKFNLGELDLWPIFVFQAIIIYLNRNFIPIWDSTIYTNWCIYPAITADNFVLRRFDCFGHVSHLFSLLVGGVLYYSKFRYYNVHYMIGFLYILSTWSFYKILCFYLNFNKNDSKYRLEIFLGTILYAFCPVIWAMIFNLNLDIGILLFSVLFFYALTYQRKWQALIYASLLIFSKAIGIFIFIVILFSYVVGNFFELKFGKDKSTIKDILKNFINQFYPLVLPVIALAWHYIHISSKKDLPGWGSILVSKFSFSSIITIALNFNLNDVRLKSFLANIFVLNFSWMLWGIIAFVLIKILVLNKIFKNNKNNDNNKNNVNKKITKVAEVKAVNYFISLSILLGMVYVTTRFLTFNNPRYNAVVLPYLIITTILSIVLMSKTRWPRTSILSILCVIIISSNLWTIDPLSKKVYGTFEYGKHSMLNMTSITNDCCGKGRDQLLYNMQYLFIQNLLYQLYDYLIDDVYHGGNITAGDPIFTNDHALFPFHFGLNIYRKLVLWKGANWELPIYAGVGDIDKITKEKNKNTFYYLSYPNYYDEENFKILNANYKLKASKTFDNYGYTCTLYTYAL